MIPPTIDTIGHVNFWPYFIFPPDTWHGILFWAADKLLPPAILAVVLSWFMPRAMERYKASRDHFYGLVGSIRAQLFELQKVSAAYWLSKHNATSVTKEAEIEFLLGDITTLIRLAARAGAPSLYSSQGAPGVTALGKLINEVTGGNYKSKSRGAEPDRVVRINSSAIALLGLILDIAHDALKTRL